MLRIFFETIENYFFWLILFLSILYLVRIKKFPAVSVYILWAYLAYFMVLIPISETGARYNFPYILFPVFAIALKGSSEENSDIETQIKPQ
ncbi:MAG: hypothetical protein IPL53_10265 [Ignavibacteria bacterium]|nr:hypothetical protein [Ignavibacteria bacterium]